MSATLGPSPSMYNYPWDDNPMDRSRRSRTESRPVSSPKVPRLHHRDFGVESMDMPTRVDLQQRNSALSEENAQLKADLKREREAGKKFHQEASVFKLHTWQGQQNVAKLNDDLKKTSERLQQEQADTAALETLLQTMKSTHSDEIDALKAQLRSKDRELKEAVQEQGAREAVLKAEIAQLENDRTDADEQVTALEAQLLEVRSAHNSALANIEALTAQRETSTRPLEEALQKAQARCEAARNDHQRVQTELNQTLGRYKQLEDDRKTECQRLEHVRAASLANTTVLQGAIGTVQGEKEELKVHLVAVQGALQNTIRARESAAKATRDEARAVREHQQQLHTAEVQDLKHKLTVVEADRDVLLVDSRREVENLTADLNREKGRCMQLLDERQRLEARTGLPQVPFGVRIGVMLLRWILEACFHIYVTYMIPDETDLTPWEYITRAPVVHLVNGVVALLLILWLFCKKFGPGRTQALQGRIADVYHRVDTVSGHAGFGGNRSANIAMAATGAQGLYAYFPLFFTMYLTPTDPQPQRGPVSEDVVIAIPPPAAPPSPTRGARGIRRRDVPFAGPTP